MFNNFFFQLREQYSVHVGVSVIADKLEQQKETRTYYGELGRAGLAMQELPALLRRGGPGDCQKGVRASA